MGSNLGRRPSSSVGVARDPLGGMARASWQLYDTATTRPSGRPERSAFFTSYRQDNKYFQSGQRIEAVGILL